MKATALTLLRHNVAAVLVVIFATSIVAPCTVVVEFDDENRLEVEQTLETLWLGTPEQRREAAENASSIAFAFLEEPSDDGATTHADIIALLRLVVASDPDDYVVATLLDRLSWVASYYQDLVPLYIDAMTHSSPNVRYEVAEFFAGRVEKEIKSSLEAMWRAEDRGWLRGTLARALDRHGSTVFLDDLIELVGSEDLDLAIAAITTLAGHDHPEALSRIIGLLDSERREVATVALWAVGYWNETEALDAMIAATRSKDAAMREHAVFVLSDFEQEAATLRLIEIATGRDDPEIRSWAICSLEYKDHPMVVPALFSVAANPDNPETVRVDAATTLYWADEEVGDALIAGLAIDEDDAPECEIDGRWVTLAPETRKVLPSEQGGGVACLRRPGGEPVVTIEAETFVYPTRRFELDGDLWVLLGNTEDRCWVPEADLERVDAYENDLEYMR